MKANPGGVVPPEQVFGRNVLIGDLWSQLEQQSVVLAAERRMGKTCVIQKMKAESRNGKLTMYRDVGAVKSPIEFANVVLEQVEEYLSGLNKTARRSRQLIKNLGGAELKGWGFGIKLPDFAAPHWKQILTTAVEDLIDHQGRTVQVVFFWDEVPWMLQEIAKREGETTATEVLDLLRTLRQSYLNLRMVFTGSIGLHHVIDRFREGEHPESEKISNSKCSIEISTT